MKTATYKGEDKLVLIEENRNWHAGLTRQEIERAKKGIREDWFERFQKENSGCSTAW